MHDVTSAFELFQKFSELSGFNFDQFQNMSKFQVKKKLKLHFRGDYEDKWSGELQLCTAENNKKLKSYKEFIKRDFIF